MRNFRILPTVLVSFGAARVVQVAVLILIGQAVLSAGVIYTFVESLPAQFNGDQPTATWTWNDASFQPVDTGGPNDPFPVLNQDAITDRYTWSSMLYGVFFASDNNDPNLSYVSVEGVTFTIGSVSYTPYNWYEDCQPVLSQTACILPSALVTWTVSNGDDVSSSQADTFSVQVTTDSAPEPGTWVTGVAVLGVLCLPRTRRRVPAGRSRSEGTARNSPS